MTRPLHVRPLSEVGREDRPRVGGKAAHLGELLRAGLPVPDGYCITTETYDRLVEGGIEGGIEPLLAAVLADLDPGDLAACEVAAQRIQSAFTRLPGEAWQEIEAAQRALKAPVAVRSSAPMEDLASASFAGQLETVLGVEDPADLRTAILRCLASLWSVRAILYRERMGLPRTGAKMAVLVQEMVASEVAGVLWTAHPVTGDRTVCVINAARGLGEGVVAGTAESDEYVLDKETGALRAASPADAGQPLLGAGELTELAALGRKVEDLFVAPQDVEWARAGGSFHLLQARPITTLGGSDPGRPRVEPARIERPRPPLTPHQVRVIEDMAQRFTGAMRPFDFDCVARGLFHGLERWMRWMGIRVAMDPELLFQMEDGVPIALHPRLRQARLGGLASLPVRLWGLLFFDPGRWHGDEQPALAVQAEALEEAAAGIESVPDAGLLGIMDRAARLISDGFFSRRRAYLTLEVGRLLRLWVERLFPEEGEAVYADLMAGVEHVTARANRALARLAEQARAEPALRAALASPDPEAALAGTAFLAGFRAVLDEHGAFQFIRFGPSWREEPAAVWSALRGLVHRPRPSRASRAPGSHPEALERCLGRVPAPLRPLFRRTVARARAADAMREDSHFLITRGAPVARSAALEAGRRLLRRGLLESADDVFFLPRSEILAALTGSAPADLQARVDRRRSLYEAVRGEGLLPSGWLPSRHGPGVLRGVPVSRGVAEGPARVIRSPADFSLLRPGEILVSPYTNPSWTVLFSVAGGVVVETGGMAAHAAIVAREYGIPAVMDVREACARIRDGQPLRVDGRTGEVQTA